MSVPALTFRATLSCRVGTSSDIDSQVRVVCGDITGLNNFILFIHGFNDTQAFADCAYRQFLSLLSAQLNQSVRPNVVGLYWPGDQPNKIKSTLDYVGARDHALTTAQLLADFLNAHTATLPPSGAGLDLDVVCHSMGNRILLETFKILRAASAPVRIRTCCLMAAAVTTSSIEDASGGPLSLWAEAASISHSAVMSSTSDDVLRLAFPPGETLCHERLFPEAVGRFGYPPGVIWSSHATFNKFGHSDYWVTPDSALVAAAAMNYGVPRTTQSSELPVNPSTTINVLASNLIKSRAIGLSSSSPCK
jgi:hypothetical protein